MRTAGITCREQAQVMQLADGRSWNTMSRCPRWHEPTEAGGLLLDRWTDMFLRIVPSVLRSLLADCAT
jgi:hypothetical protein